MRGTLDGGTVPVDHRLDRLAEMARQVPAICHPNGIGRALADAVGMGAGPIPGGDRDAGRLAQPGGQGLGLPVWRQIAVRRHANPSGGDIRNPATSA